MSSEKRWYAHVTVATIIEQKDKYLLVYEKTDLGDKYNQPAGHLEENESLLEAAIRETKEETGWDVALTGVVRINQYLAPSNGVTYIRVTFSAKPLKFNKDAKLDNEIINTAWLSADELEKKNSQQLLRSPLVLSDIRHYENNPIMSLESVHCL